MALEITVNEVLNELFEGYLLSGGAGMFDLTETIKEKGQDPHEFGGYLVKYGWVENQMFLPTGFAAQISMAGMLKAKPDFFEGHASKIINTLGADNRWIGVMQTLEFPAKDFQIAFRIAKFMELHQLVETQFQATEIFVKLTITGREAYKQSNSGSFF